MATMVNVSVPVPVPPVLVALTVTSYVPALVGVPEINPLVVLSVRPGGRLVASKLVGVFDAVMRKPSAVPTVPRAVVALVMAGFTARIVKVNVPVPVPPLLVALTLTS